MHLDFALMHWINQFVGRWPWFDLAVYHVSGSEFLKGIAIVTVYWYFLFERANQETEPKEVEARATLLTVLILVVPAMVVARGLARLLPYRERPFFDPGLHFQWPYHVDADQFIRWSSFPSDHAALFSALAMGLFFRSKRAGAVVFAYVMAVTFFPRIYMGYHWPSDILAGFVLGILVAYVALIPTVKSWSKRLYEECNKHSGLYAALLFLLTYEIGTLFNGPRLLLTYLGSLLKR
jgi:membrane-associated phospholipid phosphatase